MTELDRRTGFDTPEELIGYCEEHCQSPRGLFSGAQIFDMVRLAGFPEGYGRPVAQSFGQFFPMHESMAGLCKLARERLTK